MLCRRLQLRFARKEKITVLDGPGSYVEQVTGTVEAVLAGPDGCPVLMLRPDPDAGHPGSPMPGLRFRFEAPLLQPLPEVGERIEVFFPGGISAPESGDCLPAIYSWNRAES